MATILRLLMLLLLISLVDHIHPGHLTGCLLLMLLISVLQVSARILLLLLEWGMYVFFER